jgi:hypothetical protein
MRKYSLCLAIVFASLVYGKTNVYVYEADGNTPFNNRNIIVGTRLTLIVSSDSNEYWNGGLFIGGSDRAFGTLSARDYDANTRDFTGSHLRQAGNSARVTGWKDSSLWGFDMFTYYPVYGDSNSNITLPGDWFIVDYTAEKAGICKVGFYDYSISWSEPSYYLTFTQERSRDFNNDGKVNFLDYSILASNWNRDDCGDPNWCDNTDLNSDGKINFIDLADFVDFWLWGKFDIKTRKLVEPNVLADSNVPIDTNVPVEPNIVIRIVDIGDNNEITLDVNESITLYLRLKTMGPEGLGIFNGDVIISDTNLGSIDNREYNPNDPNFINNSTARILAEPRDPFFDYIGPGYEQSEGIQFLAANIGGNINDGDLASFVFTCRGGGNVTLSLKNYLAGINPKLVNILIHQNNPNFQKMKSSNVSSQMAETVDTAELVDWLEKMRLEDPNFNGTMTEDDWVQFIETVNSSGELY